METISKTDPAKNKVLLRAKEEGIILNINKGMLIELVTSHVENAS